MIPKTQLPKAIICDLDGTLCNISHRQSYVQSKPKNWKAFHQALSKDILYEFCAEMLQMYHERGYAILLVTGRPEEYKCQTQQWLKDHKIQYDALWMRKSGDFRKDFLIKKEIFQDSIRDLYRIIFVLEDRYQVVKMWREQGLTCLQVAEGRF